MSAYPIGKSVIQMGLLRTGKVKQVYDVDDETLEFVFTDNISVFDKIIPRRYLSRERPSTAVSPFSSSCCARMASAPISRSWCHRIG